VVPGRFGEGTSAIAEGVVLVLAARREQQRPRNPQRDLQRDGGIYKEQLGRGPRCFVSGIDPLADLASEMFVLHPAGYEGPSRSELLALDRRQAGC
jgi:hypothetical protein